MSQSLSTSNLVSSAAGAIALTVLAVASTHHVPVAHAGRALPSSFGTRGAPAQLQSQSTSTTAATAAATGSDASDAGGWFSSTGNNSAGASLLSAFRPRALKEDNKKDDKNKDKNDKDKDARDDMGDDCWGWEEGWDDDEYEQCWDGSFKYELDPESPPDRCDKWEPGDDTDDWLEVCEEWHDTYFCASGDEEAQKCGSKGKDAPFACCAGFTCGGDGMCVPLPTCAAPGTKAVGCGGAKGLFAEACCEGLECSANGDKTCVVPTPPVGDCINADFAFIYETNAGLESTVTCDDIALDDGQCDSAIVGRPELTVLAYCREICREECTMTDPSTSSPTATPVASPPTSDDVSESAVTSDPTASPTSSPTESPIAADIASTGTSSGETTQSLIPFHTYAIELIIPNISRMRRRTQENRAPVSVDEDEIERIASERIDESLAELGGGYASSTVNMERVGEYAKSDFTVLAYSLTGVARFVGSGISELPSRLEVDATVLNAFESVEFVASLQESEDPVISSVVEATVTEMDESPTETIQSSQPQPKTENSSSVTVGVIAGVAAVAGLLAIAFAVGIYRGRKTGKRNRYPSSLGPLSKQEDEDGEEGHLESPTKTALNTSNDDEGPEGDDEKDGSALSDFAGPAAYTGTAYQGPSKGFVRSGDGISVGDESSARVAPSMIGDASVTYSVEGQSYYMSGDDHSYASGASSSLADAVRPRPGSVLAGSDLPPIQDTSMMSGASSADEGQPKHRFV